MMFEAAEKGDVDSIRALLTKGASVNMTNENRQTPLYVASRGGHLEVVKELLAQGASADTRDKDGQTPFYVALSRGYLDVVKEMLVQGASVDAADKYRPTPLCVASSEGHLDVVKELLAQGASVNLTGVYGQAPLYVASRGGHIDVVKELLAHGGSIDMMNEDGRTPLYGASSEGHLDVVKELLTRGAFINTADKVGRTPFSVALSRGHLDVVKELLAQGASVDTADKHGHTPLFEASRRGHLDVVKELLAQGASVDTINKDRQTPLHVAARGRHLGVVKELLATGVAIDTADEDGQTPLYMASREGSLDVVKELLTQGASVDVASVDGQTSLYVASRRGHLDVVKELLAQGATVDVSDKYRLTPLYVASSEGHRDIVEVLVAHGASVTTRDMYGQTPLYVASRAGHLDVAKVLVAHGASVGVRNEYGQTPLYEASVQGHSDVVKELLARGASVDTTDEFGRTPLFVTVWKGHLGVVKELLTQYASVDTKYDDGRTPLFVASRGGHLVVVKELLAQGASIDMTNKFGHTPLYAASSEGHWDVVKELLAQGAAIDMTDEDGRTPFYVALWKGNFDIIKELQAHGASVDGTNQYGQSPLHVASSAGHLNVAKELLAFGATINFRYKNGCTALHAASRNGHLDVVKELLACGVAIKTRDKDGCTPLYWASLNGHFKVVDQLLICGAIVDVACWDGRTPLYMASGNGHLEIVEKLLSHGAALDMKAWDGSTSLQTALWQGHFPVVELLIHRGASVNISDMRGTTPLHVASISRNGHVDMVNLLLSHGADVGANGDLPLHCASFWGHLDIVKVLLVHCASANRINKNYCTPLHLAAKRRHLEIVQLLLSVCGDMNKKLKDGKNARDLGNQEVKKICDSFQERNLQMSMHSATMIIRKAMEDTSNETSKLFKVASSIFKLSIDIRLHRMSILSTSLILESVVRYLMIHRSSCRALGLFAVLQAIKTSWQNMHGKTNPLKMTLDNNQLGYQTTGAEIARLKDRLIAATKNLPIVSSFQVVGDEEDLKNNVPNLMDKINSLDTNLVTILSQLGRQQQRDGLVNLAVQMQRGVEHYKRQVNLGNMKRDDGMVRRFELCQNKITLAIEKMQCLQNLPQSFGFGNIESWMLSADDVQYDPNNLSTALGRGGFATVFKGMYHGETRIHPNWKRLLLMNIKAWKDISHEPYILTLVGVCTKAQPPILVSELCENNIRRYIREWPDALIPMIYQFARGLDFLHSANIIHRDLKGDNVLVTFQKTVAIADFGLSRSAESLKNTRTGNKVSGTLNWMSPEQFFSPRNMTIKSDIWPFGMTVWEILCNDTPYRRCSEFEFQEILKSEDDRPEKPEDLHPYLAPLWTLITNCWQLNPHARPSANDIVKFLESEYNAQDMPYQQESVGDSTIDADIFEMDEIDNTVTSLDQLIQHIFSEPSKPLSLLNNYVLYPKLIEATNQNIFKVRNERQPWKHLFVKLSEDSKEIDFYKSFADIDEATDYTVECFDSGEWYVCGYKCFALILQRGGEECESYLRSLFEDNTSKHKFIEQTVAATQFLHSKGWIHGNIKLENVAYFGSEERFKLMNMDHAQKINSEVTQYGTPENCPPEMASIFWAKPRP
ncbi:hypothetical protein Ae201684_018769 [Aphanomyces euteiches]|uniref:Protein kinase domain-containing protein n=1 Tax=Aphanomyces euteiches TaxID=100861 RepID=A0A6G0W4M4_9STRA|nr:hypothetical protein Ae201684_018769 [Aphanomyces euteiches]